MGATREVRVRVQRVLNIWGYREALYVAVGGRSFAAAFDEWGNCLSGSCAAVSRLLAILPGCSKLFERLVDRVASSYAVEERIELVYACGGEEAKRLERLLEALAGS